MPYQNGTGPAGGGAGTGRGLGPCGAGRTPNTAPSPRRHPQRHRPHRMLPPSSPCPLRPRPEWDSAADAAWVPAAVDADSAADAATVAVAAAGLAADAAVVDFLPLDSYTYEQF